MLAWYVLLPFSVLRFSELLTDFELTLMFRVLMLVLMPSRSLIGGYVIASRMIARRWFGAAHPGRQRDSCSAASMAAQMGPKKSSGGSKHRGSASSQGLTPRDTDFSQWYQDVIAGADLVDQSPVKGCMVIKPYGMGLWEAIRADLDARIKASGAQNAYFPLFIPVSFLSKEAEHVEGFAKECAVVTHHRLRSTKDGNGVEPDPEARLEEQLIVRPTSETMIWHMFQRWASAPRPSDHCAPLGSRELSYLSARRLCPTATCRSR